MDTPLLVLKEYRITFGSGQAHAPFGSRIFQGWLAVQACDETEARELAHELFGSKWAFIYDQDEVERMRWHSWDLGELGVACFEYQPVNDPDETGIVARTLPLAIEYAWDHPVGGTYLDDSPRPVTVAIRRRAIVTWMMPFRPYEGIEFPLALSDDND